MDTPTIAPATQVALDRLNTPSRLTGSGLGALDGGDFLRLLTTQLTLQDPLEPTDNQAMLAQMAQFSSLAATTESGATLEEISAKLDRLIAAQEATLRPAPSTPAATPPATTPPPTTPSATTPPPTTPPAITPQP